MSDAKFIFGIETSCDETSCAVVAEGRRVLSNVVAGQFDLHARFGGVVPEVASRAHIEAMPTVIDSALDQSGLKPADLAAVAVTCEPGLIGSLLVGLMAAKTLAWVWDVPLVGVNHVYAHAYSPALDDELIEYPAVALICSGGHTALYRCSGPTELELIGTTIDDAAGEAFDKVGHILNLGYPGGPAIDRLAKAGNPKAVHFPRSLLRGGTLDFSFSGLKTAVLYHVNGTPGLKRPSRSPAGSGAGKGAANLSAQELADIAASFQAAVVDVLMTKLRRAARVTGAKTMVIGGGVSANSSLRQAAKDLAEKCRCTLRLPHLRYCVDNAAQTAGLAWHYLRAGRTADLDLEAFATVRR
jgi:N6-L-threonylcarbamoyladenine synthase